MSQNIYRINHDDVVHELIDGEAILINMKTGSYYSLENSGAVVWDLLQKGPVSLEFISNVFNKMFTGEPSEMESAAAELLAKMESEGLVFSAAEAGEYPPPPPVNNRSPFLPPQLQVYTDLEALLLLDPIHDVSSEGWPVTNPDE